MCSVPYTEQMVASAPDVGGREGAPPWRTPRVTAIARLSAVDTVRARITLAVNLGLLAPDERLPAASDMAESFGVSVASVHRGLTQLHVEGVIVRRPGRYGGSFVRGGQHHSADGAVQPFLDDHFNVHALIDERAVIEAGFAALAARQRTAAELSEMGDLVERMRGTTSWAEFRNLDRAFHRLVVRAAKLPAAEELVDRTNDALDPYYLPYSMPLLHESNTGHAAILRALQSRDSGLAAELTATHIRELHESMYVGLRRTEQG